MQSNKVSALVFVEGNVLVSEEVLEAVKEEQVGPHPGCSQEGFAGSNFEGYGQTSTLRS